MTGALVAFDETTNFRAPFGRQVSDREIEGLRFGVRARGLALAYHDILLPTNVQAEGLGATLSGDLTGGGENGMQQGVV